MLMAARDEDDRGLDDSELRDEVMTMLLAGHETTANALSWALHLLAGTRRSTGALHAESSASSGTATPTLEDLPQLEYAARVLQEAMRLYPPAWISGARRSLADTVGGFRVPAGASVTIAPLAPPPRPSVLGGAGRFDRTRFLRRSRSSRPQVRVRPVRGRAAHVHRQRLREHGDADRPRDDPSRYRLEVVPDRPVEVEPSVTLRPRDGMWMTVARRAAARPKDEAATSPARV